MSETIKRALSGIIYILVLVWATFYSNFTYSILILTFLYIGIFEFSKMYKLNIIGSIIITTLFTLPIIGNIDYFKTIYPYLLFFEIPFILYLIYDLFKANFKIHQNTIIKYIYLTGYVIIPFVFLTQLPLVNNTFEPKIIIGVFILIWNNDTFAYICGKSFGKRKLFEKMSPKKTIEGFIGGAIFTLIASYILSITLNVQSFNLNTWLLTAILVSTLGTIGDLVESKFKRQANIKDSGSIMPGHGGILDRLDSIIFVTPFLFLIYIIL